MSDIQSPSSQEPLSNQEPPGLRVDPSADRVAGGAPVPRRRRALGSPAARAWCALVLSAGLAFGGWQHYDQRREQ